MGESPVAAGGFAESGHKQPSGHTKMSTNYTIHSSALEQARKAKRPAPRSNGKDNPLTNSRKLPNSKSSKKLKINLQLDHKAPVPEQSYREYCLVDENFVPIVNADDQKHLEDMLSQTATTSCDFNSHFKAAAGHTGAPQLRRRAISNTRQSAHQPAIEVVEKMDVSTSVLKLAQPECTSIEISAVPELADVGLQYSARPEEKQ
jgi:hypothetical protein